MSGKNGAALCLILMCGWSGARADEPPSFIDQYWSDQIRFSFWFMDQGSRIMPLDWFMRLEMANSAQPFASGLERYGFIPDNFTQPHDNNPAPEGKPLLPIGFARDKAENGQWWVGLTCAACHTNRIINPAKIDGKTQSWLIEGGPGMLNFDLFLSDMVDAVNAIDNDPQKKARFWKGVPNSDPQRAQFEKIKQALNQRKTINTPPSSAGPAGFARVDAFDHIFNQVLAVGLGNSQDARPPDAPASYPFLWDIAQHKFVQWNGSAPNLGIGHDAVGSLVRNIGEVLGVFGEFQRVTSPPPFLQVLPSIGSSAKTENLRQIEDWISTLRSPEWRGELGIIDQTEKAKGKEIYNRPNSCWTCHFVVERDKEVPRSLPVQMESVDEIKTDRQEIDNFRTRMADPKGLLLAPTLLDPFEPVFFPKSYVKDLTGYFALGVYVGSENPDPATVFETFVKAFVNGLINGLPSLTEYKARPLDGIWATAPYLHNGSVASLLELLTPASQRLPYFCVGDGIYDPVNVGYQTHVPQQGGTTAPNCPQGTSLVDTHAVGSTNTGHSGHRYGTDLTPEEKQSLIAYLKSL